MNSNRNDVELIVGAGGSRRVRHRQKTGWKPILGADDLRPEMSGDDLGATASQAQQVAAVALAHDPKVQAGMFLLRASKRNPKAKRKLLRIFRRADAGDPKAVAAVQTLRTAKAVERTKAGKSIKTGPGARAKGMRKQRLVLPPASGPGVTTVTKRETFYHWKKGSG